jgi:GAF domain-containing protein
VATLEGVIEDPERLGALRRLLVLDTPPQPPLDRITSLAARALDAPIALVCLVDRERQYFASAVGLPAELASRRESPLALSICKHAVAEGRRLVVPDARHSEFADHPAVTELGVSSYAGVPLFAEGHCVGTLCVIDVVPREWGSLQLDILEGLAALTIDQLRLVRLEKSLRSRLRRHPAAR